MRCQVGNILHALLVSLLVSAVIGGIIYVLQDLRRTRSQSCNGRQVQSRQRHEEHTRGLFNLLCYPWRSFRFSTTKAKHVPAKLQQPEPTEPFVLASVLQQFLERAVEEPERVVLTCGDFVVTFRALRSCAHGCAQLLLPHLRPEEAALSQVSPLVVLYLHGGPKLVAAILGTWLAKGAWVPLDRKGPARRLQELVQQIQPAVVLCDDETPFLQLGTPLLHADQLSFDIPREELEFQCDAKNVMFKECMEQMAQVVYTSGSTGTPKGVVFSHQRLAHSTHFFAAQCDVGRETCMLQKTSNVWSVFRHEVYPALCRHGRIIHAESSRACEPLHLAELVDSAAVSLLVLSSVAVARSWVSAFHSRF